LFSRNPFASPTVSDPLFADFAADRQALFDIFPSMSQDTFEILVHCLAIDPEYRSLKNARDAVMKSVCFTTDDETLDELEIPLAPVVTATANREPLRTPSISSPQLDHTGAFPWAKNLAITSPSRALSAIADEDLFGFSQPWNAATSQPDNASLVSFVDSGLGVSVKTNEMDDIKRTNAMPISGSLPATMARFIPGSKSLGAKREFQSKSWSEIFKDDDESEFEFEFDNDSAYFRSSEDLPASSDSNGSDTPRAALTELKTMPNTLQTPVKARKSEEQEHSIFDFEDHEESMAVKSVATPTMQRLFSPAKKAAIDKWSQLGDKRRQVQTPVKPQANSTVGSLTPKTTSPMTVPWRKRNRSSAAQPVKYTPTKWSLWGKTEQQQPVSRPEIMNKKWNVSQDWRKRIMPTSMADDRLVF
jgi:chemotaxis protein histidine kinase CheA